MAEQQEGEPQYIISESDDDNDTLVLVRKRRLKSVIWSYFGLKGNESGKPLKEDIDKPICKLRKGQTLLIFLPIYKNTTQLFTVKQFHLPSHQVNRYKSTQHYRKLLIEDDSKSTRACELNKAVAYYLAKDIHPLYSVERPGFKRLVSKLDPKYVLPSRNYFSDTEIPGLYNEVRDNVVYPKIKEAQYFSSTTDLWTSCAAHPYLTVTIHFVDKDWALHPFCLDTTPLCEDHTGQNISEAVKDIYQNCNLPVSSLVNTTTDNGSNFVSAYKQLNWVRLSCFGHSLDLAINKSLRAQQAIRKCHSLIELFHISWKKNRDLRQKQQELDIKEHKLISSVSTRWRSTYAMMKCILEQQQQAICAVLSNDRKNWSKMPSDVEFTTIETVVAVLCPLSVFTDVLSGEEWVNISAV